MNLIKHINKTIYDSISTDLLYFNNTHSQDTHSQNKSSVIKSANIMIYNNHFISQEKKNELINKLTTAQKVYWGFTKLAKIFKHRKAKTFDINESLYDVPFKDCNPLQIITLIEGNTKYKFRINELIYLWKISLANSYGLTPSPKNPSNPYTGLPFSYHNLYNIYFFARMNTYINIPDTIGALFKMDFNIGKFTIQYYPSLCEKTIKVYLQESENIVLFYDCINMISSNRKLFRYPNFDTNMENKYKIEFVHLLKPILTLYLYGTISCNPITKKINIKLFRKTVKKGMKDCPTFGRRVAQRPSNNVENYNRFSIPAEDSSEITTEEEVITDEEVISDVNSETDLFDTVHNQEEHEQEESDQEESDQEESEQEESEQEESEQEESEQWREDQVWGPNEYSTSGDEESN